MASPNVGFQRVEYTNLYARWCQVRDCLSGAEAVKLAGDQYLPELNYSDDPEENELRNEEYVLRAFFVNFTGRTCQGLMGQIFAVDPLCDIPDIMNPIQADADGAGVSLDQSAKKACGETLAYGRSGLLLDFPYLETPATRAQIINGDVRPMIGQYSPWSIINWRTICINSVTKLSLLVLCEDGLLEDDGFEIQTEERWRELRLIWPTKADGAGGQMPDYSLDPHLHVQMWHRVKNSENEYEVIEEFFPQDYQGKGLTFIPFQFVGSLNNDCNPDLPPLYDLSECNIAHYRNSADYEDCIHMLGQPTPWFAGLTEEWAEKHGPVQLGARGAIPLPSDGSAGLLQAAENTMVKEGMDHKERIMVALGAKLVEQKEVQRTLGEAKMERATETSVLASVAKNVSAAYTQVLRWAAVTFYGQSPAIAEAIWYTLSTDFAIERMSPDDQAAVIAAWQGGAISFTEMRDQMRQSGIATLDDQDAKDEIAADQPAVDLDANGYPVNKDPNEPTNTPPGGGGKTADPADGPDVE